MPKHSSRPSEATYADKASPSEKDKKRRPPIGKSSYFDSRKRPSAILLR